MMIPPLVDKLVKNIGSDATSSQLCIVVTSDNRQQRHCQLRWMHLRPLPIAMDAINAIIVGHQSNCKTSPMNAMRKAVVLISFGAASDLTDKHNKNIVRAL
jgi:hypothetical protein